jgi:hypothetical protein
VGRRFIVDLSTKNRPSYSVEILGQGNLEPIVLTLYAAKLPTLVKDWWHSEGKKPQKAIPNSVDN